MSSTLRPKTQPRMGSISRNRPDEVSGALLAWYDRHQRVLPWRAREGKAPDPYHVWLSEIMLQQTTVQAVKPYFEGFVACWPTIEDLAKAPLEAVLDRWAGLGYYARARNLHACACKIVADFGGRFPSDEKTLKTLPGIGDYTAGAIAAIAFDKVAAAVDGNVERVISRMRFIDEPLPKAKKAIRAETLALVPDRRAGDFAQSLMDLGATICTVRAPKCGICPWEGVCIAHAKGRMEDLPIKPPKKRKPVRHALAFWLESEGDVLLRRRPAKGLLGGMLEVPSSPWGDEPLDDDAALAHAPNAADWAILEGTVRHTFTHFHFHLKVARAHIRADARPDGLWVPMHDLDGLPTVMRKVAHMVQKQKA
ncbi:A/G-specific adenine glycosylase [Iodidimonas muriae]|uniref:A/G-specific adenine glycosylase n=1 Tax=Iodidimonas muriae TaxID=261467 RepID=UPI001E31EA1F|nr:A/G-specific adenine glycosylase [Iodidimonas muriae]